MSRWLGALRAAHLIPALALLLAGCPGEPDTPQNMPTDAPKPTEHAPDPRATITPPVADATPRPEVTPPRAPDAATRTPAQPEVEQPTAVPTAAGVEPEAVGLGRAMPMAPVVEAPRPALRDVEDDPLFELPSTAVAARAPIRGASPVATRSGSQPAPTAGTRDIVRLGGATGSSEMAGIGVGPLGVIGHGAPRPANPAPTPTPATAAARSTSEGPVPDALGTSGSRVLFSFRADGERGLEAHPYGCRPTVILEALRDTINRSRGDDEPCAADLETHASTRVLRITCEQTDDTGNDELIYFGTVWVQGTPHAMLDYEVHAFGRVLRRRGGRLEPVQRRMPRWASRQGRSIRALFDTCGQRPTDEALSSSASSSDGVFGL